MRFLTTQSFRLLAVASLLWLKLAAIGQPDVLADGEVDAKLMTVQGRQVQAMPFGAARWQAAKKGMDLKIRDQVRTGRRSTATIRLSDKSELQMRQLSTIEIQPPTQSSPKKVLNFRSGAAYFFNREDPGTTTFQTPTASGAVRGTEFHVEVAEDGTTVVTLLDGEVDLTNEHGSLTLNASEAPEQATVDPGQAPRRTAVLDAKAIIQWALYYPGVLDFGELPDGEAVRAAVGAAVEAYLEGDLVAALEAYPEGREPASASERVFLAALNLSIGEVDESIAALDRLGSASEGERRLAASLRRLIEVVNGQAGSKAIETSSGTALMVESYARQSRYDLEGALEAARRAITEAPDFGFGWVRVAELEFGFGRVEEAVAALDRGVSLSPKNAQAVALRGYMAAAENDIAGAQQYFQEAIDIDGSLGNAWLGLGLTKIRQGNLADGRLDLQSAAALEPNRAMIRSYLGKAWSEQDDNERALKEMELAKRLDPNDPTSWLYTALVKKEENQINEAVEDLEMSKLLNKNRRLYRSQLLVDQDRAVRGVNLASIYRDAGMIDFSIREAGRAVNNDYANGAAHLFLANAYYERRDLRLVNNRFETPWLNELLLANLLTPVGAGALSQNVSLQEYSKLFEEQGLGFSTTTDYFSNGNWSEYASQYGSFKDIDYAIDAVHLNLNGERPNNDFESTTIYGKFKVALTPQDTVFVQAIYNNYSAGDVGQRYRQTNFDPDVQIEAEQEPTVLAGYHHLWNPENHSLLLFGRFDETERIRDSNIDPIRVDTTGDLGSDRFYTWDRSTLRETELYHLEAQHIWQRYDHRLVLGGRYQSGDFGGTSLLTPINRPPATSALPSAVNQPIGAGLERATGYLYYSWDLVDRLQLTGGVTYDYLKSPINIDLPPVAGGERTLNQVSPKAGLIWSPRDDTHVRFAYTQSLGGVLADQSFRIEPVQVAGFVQSYRSLAPESAAGIIPGTEYETWGMSLEHTTPTRTYLGVQGQVLKSEASRQLGAFAPASFFMPLARDPGGVDQNVAYDEQSLLVTANQLVGDEWSFGTTYRLTHAELSGRAPSISDPSIGRNGEILNDQESYLHQIHLDSIYNSSGGFFGHFNANWNQQSNQQDIAGNVGDDFWQLNAFVGYRWWQRRAEFRVGIVNMNDQDYQLDPTTFYNELPRDRMLTLRFKFNY